MPRARPNLQPRGRVTLVELVVEVETQVGDGDALEEVDGEDVRLRAVGLPEAAGGGGAQGEDAAAGFVGGDGPGGEGGDFAEVRVGVVRGWWGVCRGVSAGWVDLQLAQEGVL